MLAAYGGHDNWDGPWWQIALFATGLVVGILGLVFAILYPVIFGPARRARRLRATGRLAPAWVRSVTPRPIRVGQSGGYRFKLEVESPTGRYPIDHNDLVDMIFAPYVAVGRRIMVRVDDRRPDRVAIDWDATVEAANRQPVGSLGVR